MGNHNHDAAALFDASKRFAQGNFAFSIEIGIRLVQDDKKGVAV